MLFAERSGSARADQDPSVKRGIGPGQIPDRKRGNDARRLKRPVNRVSSNAGLFSRGCWSRSKRTSMMFSGSVRRGRRGGRTRSHSPPAVWCGLVLCHVLGLVPRCGLRDCGRRRRRGRVTAVGGTIFQICRCWWRVGPPVVCPARKCLVGVRRPRRNAGQLFRAMIFTVWTSHGVLFRRQLAAVSGSASIHRRGWRRGWCRSPGRVAPVARGTAIKPDDGGPR